VHDFSLAVDAGGDAALLTKDVSLKRRVLFNSHEDGPPQICVSEPFAEAIGAGGPWAEVAKLEANYLTRRQQY